MVKPGQDVKVRMLEIDPEARRISLSIRRARPKVRGADERAGGVAGGHAGAGEEANKRKTPLKGGLDWNW